jgi:hypothetical protein
VAQGENDDTAQRLPTGSLPLNKTDWTGDHTEIKDNIGAGPTVGVFIDPEGNAWSENPDGTWTNHRSVAALTAAGRPKGRRGRDRHGKRRKARAQGKRSQ